MTRFSEQLKAPEFIEKIVLLLITAALTGVLVPLVSGRLSEARFREQKVFEAELQRQQEIVAAQAKLLERLSALLWEFQLLNYDVFFYHETEDKDAYQKAASKYQDKASEILGQIQAELSASRRLVSPAMHKKLKELYYGTLIRADMNAEFLIRKNPRSLLTDKGDSETKIDEALKDLAVDLKLVAPAASSKETGRP